NKAYLMFLVRPDGIRNYYYTQAALRGMDADFGYEFVDADWVLEFPDANGGTGSPWPGLASAGQVAPSATGPLAPGPRVTGLHHGDNHRLGNVQGGLGRPQGQAAPRVATAVGLIGEGAGDVAGARQGNNGFHGGSGGGSPYGGGSFQEGSSGGTRGTYPVARAAQTAGASLASGGRAQGVMFGNSSGTLGSGYSGLPGSANAGQMPNGMPESGGSGTVA